MSRVFIGGYKMNRRFKVLMLLVIASILLTGCKSDDEEVAEPTATPSPIVEEAKEDDKEEIVYTNVLQVTNYFDSQAEIDEALLAEADNEYPFEDPLVIVNPYGNSPLTAVAIFSTDELTGGTVTVKGKAMEDNLVGSFPSATNHIVPIYGLYPNDTTEVVVSLESGSTTSFQVTTDAFELDDQGFEMKVHDTDVYNFSEWVFVCGVNGFFYAVDSKGDIRWGISHRSALGVQPLGNGRLLVPTEYVLEPQYFKSGLIEMDLLGKVYREYAMPGGQHHDTYIMPDGNIMLASCRPSFETVEDYILEIDRETGEVLWELDMAELIDPSEGGSLNRSDRDWFHNNGVWYDEDTDMVLLSARHVDAIVGVNKTNKTLEWILGDPEGWSQEYHKYFFTPIGDDFEWHYAPHQVTVLSNGDIMCFDNGADRTKVTKADEAVTGHDVYSRTVVYRINQEDMTIEQIWQYGKEKGEEYYSEWISGAISLEDDPNNILMTFGSNLYNPEKGDYDYGPSSMYQEGLIQSSKIDQVKDDQVVFNLYLDHLTYRTLRLSAYKDAGKYDVKAKGEYKGNLGETRTVDIEVDTSNAAKAEDLVLSLDPTKLSLTASYNTESVENMDESYISLIKEDGTFYTYPITQIPTQEEGPSLVNVNGWVSTEGLQGADYFVFVIFDGTVYNTSYKIQL